MLKVKVIKVIKVNMVYTDKDHVASLEWFEEAKWAGLRMEL